MSLTSVCARETRHGGPSRRHPQSRVRSFSKSQATLDSPTSRAISVRNCLKRSGLASRRTIRRLIATYTIASLVSHNRSSSLLKRRFCPSQAKVRSTTHLLGSTVKAGRGVGSTSAATRTRRGGRLHHLGRPSQVRLDPILPLVLAVVARVRQTWVRRGTPLHVQAAIIG